MATIASLQKWTKVLGLFLSICVSCAFSQCQPTPLPISGRVQIVTNDSPTCSNAGDILVFNGNIYTMDEVCPLVYQMRIRNERIVEVGENSFSQESICEIMVDLQGHTVIPGIVEAHIHFLRTGLDPGTRLQGIESVWSLTELYDLIKNEIGRALPNSWMTVKGGWSPGMLGGFFPTQAILDILTAGSSNPTINIFLATSGTPGGAGDPNPSGVANTNAQAIITAVNPGILFLEGRVQQEHLNAAFDVINTFDTFEDKVRNTALLSEHLATVGVTTLSDFTGVGVNSMPLSPDFEPIYTAYQRGLLRNRMRPFLESQEDDISVPVVTERVRNTLSRIHDPYYRVVGLGESIVVDNPGNPATTEAFLTMAAGGMGLQIHALTAEQVTYMVEQFLIVNSTYPGAIAENHWTVAHIGYITRSQLQILHEIGAGVTMQNHVFLSCGCDDPCENFRQALDSGVIFGAGTDAYAGNTGTPWNQIYSMVTGKSSCRTDCMPEDFTISIQEAIKAFTIGSAWALRSENEIGSLEINKFGDFVVLEEEIFSQAFDSEQLLRMKPLLTVLGGKITHRSINVI